MTANLFVRRLIVPGVCTGIFGFVAFLAVHQALIANIWAKSMSGLPFAIAAGLALAFAWHVLDRPARSWRDAVIFGMAVWAALIPVTIVGALLRTFWKPRENLEIAIVLTVAALTGLAIGAFRTRRQAITFAIVLPIVVTVMTGPIPLTNGRRGVFLFLAFLPLYGVAATLLWLTQPRLTRDEMPS